MLRDYLEELKYDFGLLDAGLTKQQSEDVIDFMMNNNLIDMNKLRELYVDN